ncbi:ABC transporter permease [Leucobacter sp. W1153]|uniref:ABC transporter permease n=1 Tax=Leucobacter sp. W1153 TaxID=3439064 RepID=UPI003F3C758C
MSTELSARVVRSVNGLPAPWLRRTIFVVICGLFLVPIVSMLWFTFRLQGGGIGVEHWLALFNPENERTYRNLVRGITNSLMLAVLTIAIVWVLFLPTLVLVHLQFPKLARAFELLSVLPLAVPAIVLVVGFAPLYRVITQFLGSGVWTLSLAYGVLVLPFAYRAIASDLQGMNAVAMAEAARTLGASRRTVLTRIIAPGLRTGLTSATLITAAIVLGEFTVSSLLNRVTMQVALVEVSKSDPYAAVITSLLSLIIVFALLFAFASVNSLGRKRNSQQKEVGTNG